MHSVDLQIEYIISSLETPKTTNHCFGIIVDWNQM